MVRFFFKIGFRSVLKYRNVSFIGMLSLSAGIAVLLLIAVYSGNELSVDRFHRNASQIYKVSYAASSATPGPLSRLLQENFPEIRNATHIETHQLFAFSPVINYNSLPYEIERYYTADSSFLQLFDFKALHGDIQSALVSPFSLILTESEAIRIFDTPDPVGETVTWKTYRDFPFTVKAILKNPPRNSSIRFNGLISETSVEKMGRDYLQDWGYTVYETYIMTIPGADASVLEQKLRDFLIDFYRTNLSTRACYADAESYPLELHELREVYFNEELAGDTTNRGSLVRIHILIAVGIIIMLLSLINYVNLSVAKASYKAKDTGIQKASGAGKGSLIVQYLVETTIVCTVSAVTGIVIVSLLLPGFSRFMNTGQVLDLPFPFLLLMIPGILILGLLAGIYPAFIVSSQKVADILKQRASRGKKGSVLRNALIVFQFSASIILIASTLLINKQLSFLNNKDLGIRTENVLYARLPVRIWSGQKDIFRDRLLELPDVQKVGFSSTVFGKIEQVNSQEVNGKTVSFSSLWVDAEFVDLYGLQLSRGRFFSKEFTSDVNATALLNESALRQFDVEDPFQVRIRVPGGQATVVGIVRDFNFNSLHDRIGPVAIVYLPGQGVFANIQLSGNNTTRALDNIRDIWNELAPGFPFSYEFLGASMKSLYRDEERLGKAIMYFSLIAVFTAVLGILSLSLLVCQERVKELGIRKINGARSWDLLLLLNRKFVLMLAAAFAVACPIIWYTMDGWLNRFAYRTDIGPWIYLASGLLVSVVALALVSWQSRRFATSNPVDALRYE